MPGRRLRLEGRDYEIVSVESVDERERRVVLVCEEVLP
jgi:head-tail adaptor